ncbi:MAG: 23S rRNA (pseudouridine(1915)-N(3))-methyltransferase RlmH [Candidatus Woesearchaeota archaeon]
MNIRLLCFGKVKDKRLKSLVEEYERRLAHHNTRFSVIEWGDVDLGRQQDRIRTFLENHPESTVFLLDDQGMTMSTEQFASTLGKVKDSGGNAVFILGDAHGFGEEFKKGFSHRFSLSPMTFPHEVARLLLTEQLYRVVTLWNHIPYHK